MSEKLTFVRDTRDKQEYGWWWNEDSSSSGTIRKKLEYGDYSILGYEDRFVVERKMNAQELCSDLFIKDPKRFQNVLIGLEQCDHAWIICCSTFRKFVQRFQEDRASGKIKNYVEPDVYTVLAKIYSCFGVPILFVDNEELGKNLGRALLVEAVEEDKKKRKAEERALARN